MLGYEQFAALGVVFTVLLVAFLVIGMLAVMKESVKEKVDWWHRKWCVEIKLEELERRVSSLEEANELRGKGE